MLETVRQRGHLICGASHGGACDPAWPASYTETDLFVATVYFMIGFGITIHAGRPGDLFDPSQAERAREFLRQIAK